MPDDHAEPSMDSLVAKHHHAVYAYAFRLTGCVQDAEDLAQQAFLVAQQRLGQLRRPESARAWLYAILRNLFRKAWRGRQSMPEAETTVGVDLRTIPIAVAPSEPIDPQQLQDALQELPDEFRVALGMYYFEDLSYREIAEQLELPIGTVMSRLARAKARLRQSLFEPEQPVPAKPAVRTPR